MSSAPRRCAWAGYVIDFWGAGFDVAERMGLVPELRRLGYAAKEVRIVGQDGRRASGFPVSSFDRLTRHRYVSPPRGWTKAPSFTSTGSARFKCRSGPADAWPWPDKARPWR
ncbi:MAG TPA: hypothetical protein VNK24_07995 [Elusimicrobiota bacterium]|nr:hypothetical protein [Elusimicrobiota bacterium]